MVERRTIGGRFEVTDEIASGDDRDIYLATDVDSRDTVLVTVFKDIETEAMDRLESTARTLTSLTHPNLTRLRAYGDDGDYFYVALERAEGRDLAQVLQEDDAMTPQRSSHLRQQTLSVLRHAHEVGLDHAPVRPENVIVDADDMVKVTLTISTRPPEPDARISGFPTPRSISPSLETVLEGLASEMPIEIPEGDNQYTVWPIPGTRYDPERLGRRVIFAVVLIAVIAFTAFIWRVTSRDVGDSRPSPTPSPSLSFRIERAIPPLSADPMRARGTLLANQPTSVVSPIVDSETFRWPGRQRCACQVRPCHQSTRVS